MMMSDQEKCNTIEDRLGPAAPVGRCLWQSWFKQRENWALLVCVVIVFFQALAVLLPNWRVDSVGTKQLEEHWRFEGFSDRQFGVTAVYGKTTRTWEDLTEAMCECGHELQYKATLNTAGSIADKAGVDINVSDIIPLDLQNVTMARPGADHCTMKVQDDNIFFTHVQTRCEQYREMSRVSLILVLMTFFNTFLTICSVLVGGVARKDRSGGIIFCLFLVSSILSLGANIAWLTTTGDGFVALAKTAWYPFPALGGAFYFHFLLCWALFGSTLCYGRLVFPKVLAYSRVKATIDKHKHHSRKREKAQDKIDRMKEKLGMTEGSMPAPQSVHGYALPVQMPTNGGMMSIAPTPYGAPNSYPMASPHYAGPAAADFGIAAQAQTQGWQPVAYSMQPLEVGGHAPYSAPAWLDTQVPRPGPAPACQAQVGPAAW